jgi:hypothetical protein
MPTVAIPAFPARKLLPRAHGPWSWIGTPLLGAALLAPRPGTLLGAVAMLALLGAGHAARARAWREARAALAVGTGVAFAAALLLREPVLWLTTFGVSIAAGGATLATGRRSGRAHRTGYELTAIAGGVGVAIALAHAAGTALATCVAFGGVLLAWQVTGLWWVRDQLAQALPNREPWEAGPPLVAALVTVAGLVAVNLDAPMLAVVPVLYSVRAMATPEVRSGRDARRIGLSEAGWALGATVLAALVAP